MITDYNILINKELGYEFRTIIVRHSHGGWFTYDKDYCIMKDKDLDKDLLLPLRSLLGNSIVKEMDDNMVGYMFGAILIPHLKKNNYKFEIHNFEYCLQSETIIYD